MNNDNAKSRLTNAALARFRIVSVNSSSKLIYCPAGGNAVGSLQEAGPLVAGVETFAAGSNVSADGIYPGKEVTLQAGEVLAAGEMFKAGAYSGEDGYAVKDATKTVNTLGEVRQAATAAGQYFQAEYTR
jgi:hypothetical protein